MKSRLLAFGCLLVALLMCLLSCGDDAQESGSGQLGGAPVGGGDTAKDVDPFVMVLTPDSVGILNGAIYFDSGNEHIFYFANENGALQGNTAIGKSSDGCLELDGVIVPPGSTCIEVHGDTGLEYVVEIPKGSLLDDDELFIFGVLSDVHYNRYIRDEIDDAEVSFDLALDYFEKIGVQFVGIAGDITSNGKVSAFEKYNDAITERPFEVYTITGNHDVTAIDSGIWYQQITANLKDVELAPNEIDFVYKIDEMGGDVFVFLNQVRWEYNTEDATILDREQLEWLEQVLKENREHTVYLFFHTFLCGPDGELHTGVGNIMNPGGYTYPLPYTYGNEDEVQFRRLMKEYKNVVYFSGHSHWMFEMDVYGEETNYSDFGGEYCHMVHVPSVTEPRFIGDEDVDRTGKNGESSQGWVAYDYGETLILVPVDFITGVIYTERMVRIEQ